jgi:hypothetical protein
VSAATGRHPELSGRDRADDVPAPDDRAAADQQRLRETVDRWFPLADWQREKLSLLLHPGRGRHGAA